MSLSEAGSTSFLLGGIHEHASSVTAGSSVLPILTQSSTLNKIAAAWLQHEARLKSRKDGIDDGIIIISNITLHFNTQLMWGNYREQQATGQTNVSYVTDPAM